MELECWILDIDVGIILLFSGVLGALRSGEVLILNCSISHLG